MDTDGRYVWGIASCALIGLGSIGTWATIGPVSISGTSHGHDGTITLVLAGIALLFVLRRRGHVGIAVLGFLVLATGAYDTIDIGNKGDDSLLAPSIGWGLVLVDAAAVSLIVWALLDRIHRRTAAGTPVASPVLPPEGWYRNPDVADELRWWDGSRWTGATKPAEPPPADKTPAAEPLA